MSQRGVAAVEWSEAGPGRGLAGPYLYKNKKVGRVTSAGPIYRRRFSKTKPSATSNTVILKLTFIVVKVVDFPGTRHIRTNFQYKVWETVCDVIIAHYL